MHHIRIFRQYIPIQLVWLVLVEYSVLVLSAYAGYYLRFSWEQDAGSVMLTGLSSQAHVFAVVNILAIIALGSYRMRVTEGLTGMMLRTITAVCLLGVGALSMLFYIFPNLELYLGRGVLALAVVVALLVICAVRYIYFRVINLATLRRRVLVLGAGNRAQRLAGLVDAEGGVDLVIEGFYALEDKAPKVDPGKIIDLQGDSLYQYCKKHFISEVVVASDERRSSDGNRFPLDDLLDCKLSGIDVLDELNFCERELGKIDVRTLSPGWLVFSTGFVYAPFRDVLVRGFDVAAAVLLLLVTWPLMLLAVVAIKLEDGFRAPIFYNQQRVGYLGRLFDVHKFRSMSVDAEKGGQAVWARKNDARVTRVGSFIRNTRIDELPQILNVLTGEMSFVGPRPERPQFVDDLTEVIPFYTERHRVKPGIAGWAQLCYPYGASEEDAAQKLQYDLYYIKNHSLFFDIYILIRTIEVVLVGNGVR